MEIADCGFAEARITNKTGGQEVRPLASRRWAEGALIAGSIPGAHPRAAMPYLLSGWTNDGPPGVIREGPFPPRRELAEIFVMTLNGQKQDCPNHRLGRGSLEPFQWA